MVDYLHNVIMTCTDINYVYEFKQIVQELIAHNCLT